MVKIFIEQTAQVLPELKQAHEKNELDTVYRLSHRIKPGIDGMGISCLKNVVRTVEQLAKAGKGSSELAGQTHTLCTTLDKVLEELVNDFA